MMTATSCSLLCVVWAATLIPTIVTPISMSEDFDELASQLEDIEYKINFNKLPALDVVAKELDAVLPEFDVFVPSARTATTPEGWTSTRNVGSQWPYVAPAIRDDVNPAMGWVFWNRQAWINYTLTRYGPEGRIIVSVSGEAVNNKSATVLRQATMRDLFQRGSGVIAIVDWPHWYGLAVVDDSKYDLPEEVEQLVRNTMLGWLCEDQSYRSATLASSWMELPDTFPNERRIQLSFDASWSVMSEVDGTIQRRACGTYLEQADVSHTNYSMIAHGQAYVEIEDVFQQTTKHEVASWQVLGYEDFSFIDQHYTYELMLGYDDGKKARVVWEVNDGFNTGFFALDNVRFAVAAALNEATSSNGVTASNEVTASSEASISSNPHASSLSSATTRAASATSSYSTPMLNEASGRNSGSLTGGFVLWTVVAICAVTVLVVLVIVRRRYQKTTDQGRPHFESAAMMPNPLYEPTGTPYAYNTACIQSACYNFLDAQSDSQPEEYDHLGFDPASSRTTLNQGYNYLDESRKDVGASQGYRHLDESKRGVGSTNQSSQAQYFSLNARSGMDDVASTVKAETASFDHNLHESQVD